MLRLNNLITRTAFCTFFLFFSCATFAEENTKLTESENIAAITPTSPRDIKALVIPVGTVYVQWVSDKYSGLAGVLGGAIGGLISSLVENSDKNEAAANRKFLATVVVNENFQPTFSANLAAKLNSCKINSLVPPNISIVKGTDSIKGESPVTSPDLIADKSNEYFIEVGIYLFKITAGLSSDSVQGYVVANVFDARSRALLKKYKDYNGLTQPVNVNNFSTENPKAIDELQKALREVVEIVNKNIADSICSDYGPK